MENHKNEKVVHTRVSQSLFNKISAKAKRNRISTSNLIRNLVEDYLELHADIWDALDHKIRKYLVDSDDSIIGYQSIILSRKVTCAFCEKTLNTNEEAFIGYFEKSPQKIIVCPECKKQASI